MNGWYVVSLRRPRPCGRARLPRARLALLAPPAAAAATRGSRSRNYQWSRPAVHIDLGEQVTWYWLGPDTQHSVTGIVGQRRRHGLRPRRPAPQATSLGDRFKLTVQHPGTYAFQCKLHSIVRGTVVVSSTPGRPGRRARPDPPQPRRPDAALRRRARAPEPPLRPAGHAASLRDRRARRRGRRVLPAGTEPAPRPPASAPPVRRLAAVARERGPNSSGSPTAAATSDPAPGRYRADVRFTDADQQRRPHAPPALPHPR